jgi:antitoxin VapB
MNDTHENQLREMPLGFKHAELSAALPVPVNGMQNSLRVKIFKSGNSLALRLPASLGLEAGMEMDLTPDGAGGYHLRAAPNANRKFNVDAIWGIGKDLGLKPIAPEDRLFDEVKRPWDDPAWRGWGKDGA